MFLRIKRKVFKTRYGNELIEAVKRNDFNCIKQHIKHGGDLNTYCSDGMFAPLNEGNPAYPLIVTASSYATVEMLQFLLKAGADVNARAPHGSSTPLMEAARSNKSENVRFLLQHGADVNAKDWQGNTALYYACSTNNLELIQQLVAADANVTTIGAGRDHTCLMQAITSNCNLEIVNFLIHSGAGLVINAKDCQGHTALTRVAWMCSLTKGSCTQYLEAAKLLLVAGGDAEIDINDNEGNTALHYAVKSGSLALVQLLLQHGADVYCKDRKGLTPEMIATNNGEVAVARFLQQFAKQKQPLLSTHNNRLFHPQPNLNNSSDYVSPIPNRLGNSK